MRYVGLLAVTAVCALLIVPAATAATPEQIHRDLADNGVLDGRYTQADLARAQQNPTVGGYDNVAGGAAVQQGAVAGQAQAGTLPFTGIDLAMMALGGGLLLAIGFALRRATAARSDRLTN